MEGTRRPPERGAAPWASRPGARCPALGCLLRKPRWAVASPGHVCAVGGRRGPFPKLCPVCQSVWTVGRRSCRFWEPVTARGRHCMGPEGASGRRASESSESRSGCFWTRRLLFQASAGHGWHSLILRVYQLCCSHSQAPWPRCLPSPRPLLLGVRSAGARFSPSHWRPAVEPPRGEARRRGRFGWSCLAFCLMRLGLCSLTWLQF